MSIRKGINKKFKRRNNANNKRSRSSSYATSSKTKLASMIDNDEIDDNKALRTTVVDFMDEQDVERLYYFLQGEELIDSDEDRPFAEVGEPISSYKSEIATLIDEDMINSESVLRTTVVNFMNESEATRLYDFYQRVGIIVLYPDDY